MPPQSSPNPRPPPKKQLAWEPIDGAGSYIIIPYDSYSGRSLGIQYTSYDNSISIDGLPLGQAMDIVVQVGSLPTQFGIHILVNLLLKHSGGRRGGGEGADWLPIKSSRKDGEGQRGV